MNSYMELRSSSKEKAASWVGLLGFLLVLYFLIFILYGSVVDLQCCVSFRCTAQ